MTGPQADIPEWLAQPEQYRPGSDRDGFISRSLLSISSALALFRLDDGRDGRLSPSAPTKLALGLGCVLLVSLARNHLFVLVVLACALVRACLLPRRALARVAAGAGAAAGLTFVVMLPAIVLGQPHAAVLLATKALASTGLVLTVALTTPVSALTRSLRRFGLPGIAIMTIELTLRGIVTLGETASEILTALRLRSVGRNPDKRSSMGGVGGVVLLKAGRAAQDTYDAMRCRGFDGAYRMGADVRLRPIDAVYAALFALLTILFAYTQGLV